MSRVNLIGLTTYCVEENRVKRFVYIKKSKVFKFKCCIPLSTPFKSFMGSLCLAKMPALPVPLV